MGEEIRAEIARILREDATDRRLRLVTLTRVDVAPDLTRADVFWSVIESRDGAPREDTERALERAAGFVRHRLAEALALRRVPTVHFHYDPSLALGSETLGLLRQLRREDEE